MFLKLSDPQPTSKTVYLINLGSLWACKNIGGHGEIHPCVTSLHRVIFFFLFFVCFCFQQIPTLPTELFGVPSPRTHDFARCTSSFLFFLLLFFFFSKNPHTANGTVRCTKCPSAAEVVRLRQRLSVRGPGPSRPWAELTWAESSTPSPLGRVGPGPSRALSAARGT